MLHYRILGRRPSRIVCAPSLPDPARPSGRVPAAGSEPGDKPGVVKKDFLQPARQLSSGFLEAQKMEFQCALRPREQFGLDTHAATETISPIDQE